jgi:hypothetical protein
VGPHCRHQLYGIYIYIYICILPGVCELIDLHYLLLCSDRAGFCSGNTVDSYSVLRVVRGMIARNIANNTERGPRIVNHSQSSFAFSFRETAWPSDYTSMQAANQMLNDPRFHSFCCEVNISMSYCFPQQHLMYDDPPHTQGPVYRCLVLPT